MISSKNQPICSTTSVEDFTEQHFRELICIAKKSYSFVSYDAIPWGSRFILWRHDLDFSINRAMKLAEIEAEEGIISTYFINPHSEFYNPFESSQNRLLRRITGLGHKFGLHFDAEFHNILNEDELHDRVFLEGRWIESLLGVRPDVFSYHNPTAKLMQYDADNYGGMLNCYSRRFKNEVPYCSDSNGYWRFRPLYDVLSQGSDPCLQVLTHPGWWQKKPMPPRQRAFRSAYGRADAMIRNYDEGLRLHDRLNHGGFAEHLLFLQPLHPRLFALCDYFWNQEQFAALFLELWRLHEHQINQFCKAMFYKNWQVPASEVNAFFDGRRLVVDGWRLFGLVFETTWQVALGIREENYREKVNIRNGLILGCSSAPRKELEDGCIFLCNTIEALMKWGNSQPLTYDGISHLSSIGIPAYRQDDGSLTERLEETDDKLSSFHRKQWEKFKAEMQQAGVGEKEE